VVVERVTELNRVTSMEGASEQSVHTSYADGAVNPSCDRP
jgi:hypothetical protein